MYQGPYGIASSRMKFWLKYAILWHRFLGIAICLFFGIWFVSGVVMMYARMPELLEADRLARLPHLDLSQVKISPSQAAGNASKPQQIEIGMLGTRPVYRILPESGNWFTMYADDGTALRNLDRDSAIKIAAQFGEVAPSELHWVREFTDVDQWTVYPAARPYLPFHLLAANDSQSTKYYVSAATGSVYLATTRRGRFLAWCGAIPHWWYIRGLRANTPLWRIVMIVASAVSVVMCIAGILAGVLRYSPSKRYRFPGPRYSSIPHTGNKRWHYILGYGFGLVTFTWILSGLFSMNPGHWSPGPEPTLSETQTFAGSVLNPSAFKLNPAHALALLQQCVHPKELEMMMFEGRPYYLGRESDNTVRLLSASGDSSECISQVPITDVLHASRRVGGNASILDSALLTSYDAYYYDRHHLKPLPVVRVRLADRNKTWLYINPRTAMIQARYTDRSRLERWLYNGLHSLDFPFLYHHRPLWDITVIVLSAGGFVLSITGIILALRYLRRSLKRRRQQLRAARTPRQREVESPIGTVS
jgi:hypothetical protein